MNWQDLSSVLSSWQNSVSTLASAAIVKPYTKITILTGTALVLGITPPLTDYFHELYLVPSDPSGISFGGGPLNLYNIASQSTIVNQYYAAKFIYNTLNKVYYQVY